MKTMMAQFSAGSDDRFEVHLPTEGKGIEAKANDAFNPDTLTFKILSPGGNQGCYITAIYSHPIDNGCWIIGIQQLEEGIDIPTHWIHKIFTDQNGYSPIYVLDLPKGTVITSGEERLVV